LTAAPCRKRECGVQGGVGSRVAWAPIVGFVHEPEGGVMSELLLDRAGRRRSPATLPGFHAGHAPGNKCLRYPTETPKVEQIIAVTRTADEGTHGRRVRGLIVIVWRAGLRIQEALALTEGDLDQRRGALLVRRDKGGRTQSITARGRRRTRLGARIRPVRWRPGSGPRTRTAAGPKRSRGSQP
jgi:hypothetical protein